MSDLFTKMQGWLKPWTTGTSPLEIRRAVLDDAEARVIAVGEGKRIFPFNRLTVHLLAPDPLERAALEAVAQEGWALEQEIAGRLTDQGCPVPPDLAVTIVFEEEALPQFGDRRFFVEYAKAESAPAEVESERPMLEVTVLKGEASQHVYELEGPRILLGRLEEVVDADGRIRRRNDVAFHEQGQINSTVSREHARITWDGETAGYWLRAEQNASATRIYRAGRTIEVSAHDRRGVRLQPGDEIYLGRACVKVGMR
ncbi:MAG TPA: FHA domain-containing protein [Thermoanaerobaculia bacterium]|nr:FHA domain-containing protein [Thermoanaerobaculia bacterium]